jgi:hypothetical protein
MYLKAYGGATHGARPTSTMAHTLLQACAGVSDDTRAGLFDTFKRYGLPLDLCFRASVL